MLRARLAETGWTPDRERTVVFRPATWRPRFEGNSAALSVLRDLSPDEVANRGQVRRADIAQLSRAVDATDPDSVIRLFVATMMWGSGTTNGRGPRYTAAALDDPRLIPSLVDTRQLVLDGEPGEAYVRFRSRGVGPAFFTKWFWASGIGHSLAPPLILDARVWASLGALGWDSRQAAGSTKWSDRYAAYLDCMERWASSSLPGIETAEDLEQVLFRWAGR